MFQKRDPGGSFAKNGCSFSLGPGPVSPGARPGQSWHGRPGSAKPAAPRLLCPQRCSQVSTAGGFGHPAHSPARSIALNSSRARIGVPAHAPPPAALCDRREQVSCRDYRRQRAVKGWGLRSSGYARTPQSPLHMLCMPRSRCCSCSPLCPPPLMYHPPMTDAMSVALSQVLRVNLVISTILYKQGRGLGSVSRYLTRPCPDSPPPLLDVSTYEHAWASSLPRRRVWWGRGAP